MNTIAHHLVDITVAVIGLFWVWRSHYWKKRAVAGTCAECGKSSADGWALYCVKCCEDHFPEAGEKVNAPELTRAEGVGVE